MFDRILTTLKIMWAEKRKALIIAACYIPFMLLFYVIGATKAQFTDLIAVYALTGFYAVLAWFINEYLL
jgi:hypothetical protein